MAAAEEDFIVSLDFKKIVSLVLPSRGLVNGGGLMAEVAWNHQHAVLQRLWIVIEAEEPFAELLSEGKAFFKMLCVIQGGSAS